MNMLLRRVGSCVSRVRHSRSLRVIGPTLAVLGALACTASPPPSDLATTRQGLVLSPIPNAAVVWATNPSMAIWTIVYDPILGGLSADVTVPFAIVGDDPGTCRGAFCSLFVTAQHTFTIRQAQDGVDVGQISAYKGTEVDDASGVFIADSATSRGLVDISAYSFSGDFFIELRGLSPDGGVTPGDTLAISPVFPIMPATVTVQPFVGTNPCYGPAIAQCIADKNSNDQFCITRGEIAFWQCETNFSACVQSACNNEQGLCKGLCQRLYGDCPSQCGDASVCLAECNNNFLSCNGQCSADWNSCMSYKTPVSCSIDHETCKTNADPESCLAGSAATYSDCIARIPICI
jgi:hypothetical protein